MRQNNGARTATAERAATPKVAPRFTRAAQTERSRLQNKRAQLLRKREAVQAELGDIDRAVGEIDELLELLAPLLGANGSETAGAGDSRTGAEAADQPQPAKE